MQDSTILLMRNVLVNLLIIGNLVSTYKHLLQNSICGNVKVEVIQKLMLYFSLLKQIYYTNQDQYSENFVTMNKPIH
jgi:hypothetical protein